MASAPAGSAGTRLADGPPTAQNVQAGQADELPAANRKKQPRNPGTQIACTRVGCKPIPRGCHIEIERNWDGLPTGYDAVVCPYR